MTMGKGKSNTDAIDEKTPPYSVYIGAVQCEIGPVVPLEAEISDEATCVQLRAPNHGADKIPRWNQDIVELAEIAARKSIAASGRAASDIEAVFLVSNGLDAQNSLDAAWLGTLSKQLGLRRAAHYQIGMAGCAGFHWAAKLAASLIGSGQCQHILIISFDKAAGALQRFYGEGTDFPYLTGDAAAACMFSSTINAMQYKLLGKVVNIWDGEQTLHVSLDEEARCIAQLFQETYVSAGLTAADIDLLITNNYSFDVSRLYALLADVSYTKVFTDTIPTHAHCFASDNIINLYHTQRKASVVAGNHLMLFSAGPFQWGACVLEKLSWKTGMSSILSRFNEVVNHHADTLALVSDDKALSYGALRGHAADMAVAIDQHFRKTAGRDAGPGDVIGISLDKGPDLYVAMLAILAVGASYVPVDPELGRDAVSYILDHCQCRLVITQPGLLAEIGGIARLPPISLTEAESSTTASNCAIYFDKPRANDIDRCYTIFTSGSTGRPKGVQIHHQNLLNLVAWVGEEFTLGPAKRILQYSTINFDASVLDVFPTLLSGATLCIPGTEQRLSEASLAEFCERHQVEQAFLPPALLAVLNAERFPTLTTILTGGESCSPSTIQAWLPGRRVYNLYGPTECTVLISFKRMQPDTSQANIGQAISNVRLHVLDEHMQPALRGELHAAGPCVSPGYIGDSTTTARKFISHPLVDESVLYKTGDIVEIDAAGDLHFIGRVDRQVKLRGYRIELEEIEAALMNLGYTQVAVKVSSEGDMIAYLAPAVGQATTALRDRLAASLSSYKIPQFFVEMDRLPIKLNGKVAYDALPDLQSPITPSLVAPQPDQDDDYTQIFALWAQALNQPLDTLHPCSNFRDLGGTSLSMVHLLSNIETQFGVRIPFLSFLNNPTPGFLLSILRTKTT